MVQAPPARRRGVRPAQAQARVRLAGRQGVARGPLHNRRPDHGHRAAQPAPHRPGGTIPQSRRLPGARRGPSRIQAGAGRPARALRPQSTRRSSSMTYFEGFVAAVPEANKEAYRKHAADAAPIFLDLGVQRHFEAWDSDIPEGKVTDFRKAVEAKPDEKVVFAWFEYPDKATRDAANAKMRADPRMEDMGKSMPFDGKRMIYGGFNSIVEEGSERGDYTDGFV